MIRFRNINRIIAVVILMISVAAFSSFINPHQNETSNECFKVQNPDTRSSMLNILEALESGQGYEKPESWAENSHLSFEIPAFRFHRSEDDFVFGHDFDYEFDFRMAEFGIDEQFLKELEERMEHLERKMQERFKVLEECLETLHKRN